ncbi:type II secretion system F family protein [Hyphomonas jannaschiana]|uniref:General secretion pathway protein F n=1 Tax=Hyphomonas jannaschiana VP2 TaxID=1280952 RepID=A0A059F9A9_9PROT|nr:type II secretion system F family protein [Hyphomonas jannaschiana]KCZ87185.1 general secretion pathway protein F [Hyphomonas jannaschiana VP2]
MAAFEYVALDNDGKRRSGVISADSARSARKELRLRELMVLNVNPVAEKQAKSVILRGRISEKQRVLLVRQMSVLLKSGLAVEQALGACAGNENPVAVQKAVHTVRADVVEGARLSDAMALAPDAFPPLVRAVTSAGEMSGKLGDIMESLATYLERTYQLRQKVRAALIYPALLSVMALGMVVALMVVVVPRLVEQFDLFDAKLPLLTRIVIGLSNGVREYGLFILLLLAALSFLGARLLRQPAMRRSLDRAVLKLPLIGQQTRTVAAARFARVFATLSASGATALESLEGAKGAANNTVFADAADFIAERVREGGSFSAALSATGAFPPMMVHMVTSGEAGRDVPGMMNRAADFLDTEFETGSAALLAVAEPLIIVLMGGIVGLIVLSIMLPILQLNTLAMS